MSAALPVTLILACTRNPEGSVPNRLEPALRQWSPSTRIVSLAYCFGSPETFKEKILLPSRAVDS
jgi:hypothetical protein